jgi:hypothetical protein
MDTSPFIRAVTQVKAPLGTMVAMVGMRASCHPMPAQHQTHKMSHIQSDMTINRQTLGRGKGANERRGLCISVV